MPDIPIAIVGVSCRLPGGISTLDELWSALSEGRDLVGPIPEGRFDTSRFFDPDSMRPGKSYTFEGGFLTEIAGFDARYFGVSPREATAMDPQQRMLLELAAEAFDDAGLNQRALAGTDTGVFVGLSANAYGTLQAAQPDKIDVHTMTGSAVSINANRLSYVFDLHGPSLVVDTACSSALFAVHQACAAIRAGRSAIALAGAFNLLLDPTSFIGFSKAMMLSPTYRCRAFSADADGYVRAEGGGLFVLKRLDAALADGDRVHAVILASGTNTNGRTSGIAMPSVERQSELLRGIYTEGGIDPEELVYVEAHGTGTPAGDPAECVALGSTLGGTRTAPLPIGSVKSNMGHLETASGIAGLLKAILVLKHGKVPATLHADPLNPAIDFDGLGLAPAVEPVPTRPRSRPIVGVNGFGFGGANGHVALTGACEADAPAPRSRRPVPVVISARSEAALAQAVRATRDRFVSADDGELYDLAYTSCLRRTAHELRAAVLAESGSEVAAKLDAALAEGVGQVVAPDQGGIAFVFSGNGSQWTGMGSDLLESDSVFRDTVTEVDAALRPRLGWSVLDEIRLADPTRLQDTAVAQPLLFAVQIGLTAVLADCGVQPQAVFGHSVGEIPAAYVAGALELDTAAEIVVERSRAQAHTVGTGRMAAIGLPADQARQVLAEFDGRLDLAAINSARDVTAAGDAEALRQLGEKLTSDEVFFRELDLDYAFHSHAMDPIEAPLRAGLTGITARDPQIPLVSTVTGREVTAAELDVDHWWRNLRAPVLFAQATEAVRGKGIGVIVEIGPHPVLTTYLRRLRDVNVIATLSKDNDGRALRADVVTGVLVAGGALDWTRYFPVPGKVRDLPRYPWQRELFWNVSPRLWIRTSGTGRIDHPLLGERMPSLEWTWLGSVEPSRTPWVADHRICGSVLMPGTAHVEMALAAGKRATGHPVELTHLDIVSAMTLSWDPTMNVQTHVSLSDEDGVFRMASREGTDAEWRLHARGRVRRLFADQPAPVTEPHTPRERTTAERFYADCARSGLEYGPSLRLLREIRIHDHEVWADYEFTESQDGYEAHPALLDGALQTGVSLLRLDARESKAALPVSIARARLWQQPSPRGSFRVITRSANPREVCWDIVVADDDGTVAVELLGCRLRSIGHLHTVARDIVRLDTVLRAAPLPGEAVPPWPLAAPADLTAAVEVTHDQDLVRDRSREFLRACAELDAHFAVRAFTELAGRRFTVDDLVTAGVQRLDLLDTLLGLAQRHGPLTRDRNTWRVDEGHEIAELVSRLGDDFPEFTGVEAVHTWCGEHLRDVLCGRIDPETLLFGEHGFAAYLTDLSPLKSFHLRTIRELVRGIVRDWPADRPLRVLEVGGGTGGTAAWLLGELPADRTRYVFTDSSTERVRIAQDRFAEHDFTEYRLFDNKKLAGSQFDLVIAGDGVPAGIELSSLSDLLCSGGLLIAAVTHDPAVSALTFGLLGAESQSLKSVLDHGFSEMSELIDDPFSVVVAAAAHRTVTTAAPTTDARWAVLVDDPEDRERADALAGALREAGAEVMTTTGKPELAGLAGVAFVAGGRQTDPVEATARRAATLRAIVTTADTQSGNPLPLWIVTRPSGALPPPERPEVPADAGIWAVGRTVANEHSRFNSRRISWAAGVPAQRVVAELLDPDDEDEIVLVGNGRFVPRTVADARPPRERTDVPRRLVVDQPSLRYRLAWTEEVVPEPGPHEVVIHTRAAALNYRDVMAATGILPPEAEEDGRVAAEHTLGLECSGVITAVGADVTDFRAGDRVMTMFSGTLASSVVVPALAVCRMPDGVTFTEATTLPGAWITVHHSLNTLAQLQAGETVLVHGAAGGVGLAAIEMARARAATVIATAGTPLKRNFLRQRGIEHVLDSRDLAFADQVMAITGGRGVDVVLNSLGGEALTRSLELLAPHGRFVELGKSDIYRNSRLPMRPLRDNISVFTVDMRNLPVTNPALADLRRREVEALIAGFDGRALPHRVYPAARVGEAFRLMQRSQHIGKIVITFDESVPVERRRTRLSLDPNATYLVVGGVSGFGAATTRRLAERGARHLTLVSRRAAMTPQARTLVRELTAQGVDVAVHPADVTDRQAMAGVFASIDHSGHPLRGVVHAAMVLDDRLLVDMDDHALRTALDPKIGGALVLDELTRQRELDFFVLYSSVVTVIGNIKQANYVAGNLFLEALARSRRAQGKPALAIQFGALEDTGYIHRTGIGLQMEMVGMRLTSPGRALDAVEDAVSERQTDVVAAGVFEWGRMREFLPSLSTPRLAGLLSSAGEQGESTIAAFLSKVSELPREDALRAVEDALTKQLASIMQIAPERIDRTRDLDKLGVDSLMTMELLLLVRKRFQYQASMADLLKGPRSIRALAELVVNHLTRKAEA